MEFFRKLINLFYSEEICEFVDQYQNTTDEKKAMFMFIILYFYIYINYQPTEENIYLFLKDIVENSQKRQILIETYNSIFSTLPKNLLKN